MQIHRIRAHQLTSRRKSEVRASIDQSLGKHRNNSLVEAYRLGDCTDLPACRQPGDGTDNETTRYLASVQAIKIAVNATMGHSQMPINQLHLGQRPLCHPLVHLKYLSINYSSPSIDRLPRTFDWTLRTYYAHMCPVPGARFAYCPQQITPIAPGELYCEDRMANVLNINSMNTGFGISSKGALSMKWMLLLPLGWLHCGRNIIYAN